MIMPPVELKYFTIACIVISMIFSQQHRFALALFALALGFVVSVGWAVWMYAKSKGWVK